MILSQAKAIVEEVLKPLPADTFLDTLGSRVMEARGDLNHVRVRIFGPDPRQTLLAAFETHAANIGYHGVTPTQPPPALTAVGDEDAFLSLIRRFHERDYTISVADVVPLSSSLQRFTRALEYLLHQPVTASLFWSKAGAKAIVHYDKRDNLIIQLSGRKRWFISTDPPGLQNNWKQVGEPLPNVNRHKVYDVEPGDLLYIPRGTPHTVDSTSESLHLAILVSPVTLRDAIIAALDHLSDLDRSFRETAAEDLPVKVMEGIERLRAQCGSPDFVEKAMERRSSRAISDLPRLPKSPLSSALGPATRISHSELAICHIVNLGGVLDFSQPGDHFAIHEGAEPALRFIADNASFRIRDVPGLADDVRIALVARLISSGLLQLADSPNGLGSA